LKLTYSLLLLLPVGLVTSTALVHRTASIRSSVPVESSPVRAATVQDVPQVISLLVTPNGFEPQETIAPKGKFLILLQNRTGRRDLTFWLARENQGRVAESKPERRDWSAQVQLAPGTYVVGETNHPEWQSIIRVTN